MFNYGWGLNFAIVIIILALVLLAFVFTGAVNTKPSENPLVLKYFDTGFLKKASEYNRTALLLSAAERFLSWVFLFGILAIIWKNSFFKSRISIAAAFGLFVLLFFIFYMVLLPLQYYKGFVLEHKFGLSNQTLSAWFIDILKDRAISIIINTVALTGIYALLFYYPKHWWIIATLIFIIFIIIANFIFPVLIDPLFYKFTPLSDKELESEIMHITQKAGIKIDKVLIADASRKTNRTNAYFTGLGSTKRIVLYDNLVNNHPDNEVASVVAHEAAHWKYKHILISIILGSAGILIMMFIIKHLQLNFLTSLHLTVSFKLVLIIFIIFSFMSYITVPFQNFVSRQFEKQADKVSIDLTGDPGTSISMFQKLAVSNLSDVYPPAILKYTIYSHPPIIERVETMEKKNTY